jgi:16S rRNA (adenine1518-N6/adenine1519-N6)-dimethyltransferase
MSFPVPPKKSLGQHFLKDNNIARKIVNALPPEVSSIIEIGPGMGVLTRYLIERPGKSYFIETDREAIRYLEDKFPQSKELFIRADFLKYPLEELFQEGFSIIGNFPYHISSQIFFRVLDYRSQVQYVVGMVQKEVAERLASPPGSKKYGILSVLLQAFYQIEYLFTVNETVFIPPPKVKSAVIRLRRNDVVSLDCNEDMFFKVVKAAFNQRRKTIRNSLRSFYIDFHRQELSHLAEKRPEQLGVVDFVMLARWAV